MVLWVTFVGGPWDGEMKRVLTDVVRVDPDIDEKDRYEYENFPPRRDDLGRMRVRAVFRAGD